MPIPLLLPLLILAVLASGCDSPSGESAAGPAAVMEIVSGDQQAGTVGEMLPLPLVVRVTDAQGHPVARQLVDFGMNPGSGSTTAGAVLTDRHGEARDYWTLGSVAGESQRAEARVLDTESGAVRASVVFTARAAAGTPAAIQGAKALDPGMAGTAVPQPVEARVVDRFGNPVTGVEVAWTIVAGGGSVQPHKSVSDTLGVARTTWSRGTLLGTAHVLQASASSATAQWTTIAVPTQAVALEPVPWSEWQGGLPGERLSHPLHVTLRRVSDGAPVPGAWVRIEGPGELPGLDSALTDAAGRASLTPRLGPGTGQQRFFVSVLGTRTALSVPAFAHPAVPVLTVEPPTQNSFDVCPAPGYIVRARVTSAAGSHLTSYPVHMRPTRGTGRLDTHIRWTNKTGEVTFGWCPDSGQQVLLNAGPTSAFIELP